ncbi:hypothetical protein L6452_43905 [Arctium lappa]|uniref:Uncharacterized protein n=1 Tax=Arctium lappa TaxID=4217 RepID=A0ACB8XER1_ARCLA|nr:hypothetical protein L6452_43905 [Arctium lappa]
MDRINLPEMGDGGKEANGTWKVSEGRKGEKGQKKKKGGSSAEIQNSISNDLQSVGSEKLEEFAFKIGLAWGGKQMAEDHADSEVI